MLDKCLEVIDSYAVMGTAIEQDCEFYLDTEDGVMEFMEDFMEEYSSIPQIINYEIPELPIMPNEYDDDGVFYLDTEDGVMDFIDDFVLNYVPPPSPSREHQTVEISSGVVITIYK